MRIEWTAEAAAELEHMLDYLASQNRMNGTEHQLRPWSK